MSDSNGIECYLAEQTQPPLDVVTEIYRAGTAWPTFGGSIEHAASAVETWCQEEEQRLAVLFDQAQDAIDQPWFEHALTALAEFPALQQMIDYSRGVALLTGDEVVSVFAVHLAVLGYAIEHPDWDPTASTVGVTPA